MKDVSEAIRYSGIGDLAQILRTNQARNSGLRTHLVRGTTGAFVLQAVSTALGFLTNVLLTRLLGAAEYGIYTYVYAWLGVLAILSTFGIGNVLVREISAYQAKQEWNLISGIVRWTGSWSIVVSMTVVSMMAIVISSLRRAFDQRIFPAMWLALISLPAVTIFSLSNQALAGTKRVVLSKATGVLVRAPLYFLLLVTVLGRFPEVRSASTAVLLSWAALAIALAVSLFLLYKALPREAIEANPEYRTQAWIRSALPLLLVAGLFEINSRVPVLLLGTAIGPEVAGAYSVAASIAGILNFILLSVNSTIAPVVSDLYASGEMGRLQHIITRATRVTALVSVAIALPIIAMRRLLLGLFGSAFLQADWTLILLCIGQLVNGLCGSVGTLLTMTGHEREVVRAVGLATVLVIALSLLLIRTWGIDAIGFLTVFGIAIWNVILTIQVRKKLGIDSTVLGRPYVHS